jgi:hypothetical protein
MTVRHRIVVRGAGFSPGSVMAHLVHQACAGLARWSRMGFGRSVMEAGEIANGSPLPSAAELMKKHGCPALW